MVGVGEGREAALAQLRADFLVKAVRTHRGYERLCSSRLDETDRVRGAVRLELGKPARARLHDRAHLQVNRSYEG